MTKIKSGYSGGLTHHSLNESSDQGAVKTPFRLVQNGSEFVGIIAKGPAQLGRTPFLNEGQRREFFANITKETLSDPSHPYSGLFKSLSPEQQDQMTGEIASVLEHSHLLRRSVTS